MANPDKDSFNEKLAETFKLADEADNTIKILRDIGDEETCAKVQELIDETKKNLDLILEKYTEDMEKLFKQS